MKINDWALLGVLSGFLVMGAYSLGNSRGFEKGLRLGEASGYSRYSGELRALVDLNDECQKARWHVIVDSTNSAMRTFIRIVPNDHP